MKKTLLKGAYKPPEVEVWHVEVELGYGSSGSGGGGFPSSEPDDDGSGSSLPDMPIVPFY